MLIIAITQNGTKTFFFFFARIFTCLEVFFFFLNYLCLVIKDTALGELDILT